MQPSQSCSISGFVTRQLKLIFSLIDIIYLEVKTALLKSNLVGCVVGL